MAAASHIYLAGLLGMMAAAGCAAGTADTPDSARPAAVAPMRLEGERVLVLPFQAAATDARVDRERATAELMFALGERSAATTWVSPAALQRALQRSPGYAPDPAAVPGDQLLHHGERYAEEPMAGALRRYTALMDTRLVLLPRAVSVNPMGDSLQLSAALLDSRTGNVLWWGSAEATYSAQAADAALRDGVAELVRRFVAGRPAAQP